MPAPDFTNFDDLETFVGRYPRSPLAVKIAGELLERGEVDKALTLCRRTLEYYPHAPAALLLAAKADVKRREFSAARERLQYLVENVPGSLAAHTLLAQVDKYQRQTLMNEQPEPAQSRTAMQGVKQPTERSEKRRSWSWNEYLIPGSEAIAQKRSRDMEEPQPAPPPPSAQSDDLERLAEDLQHARTPKAQPSGDAEDQPEFQPVNLETRPVTETLAEIYVNQGKFAEAIDAYRKLREKHRDRSYEFTTRISEIKRLQEGRS